MNKILKMVGTASLVGSMAMLVGCGGGGGGGGSTAPVVPDGTQVISATSNGVATSGVDTFKLIDADLVGYSASIAGGFKYGQDWISYPNGGTPPRAYPSAVNNDMADGKVDLTWISNGKEVTIALTGLAADAEQALTSNSEAADPYIYKKY